MEKTAMQQLLGSIKGLRYYYEGTQWAAAFDSVIGIINNYLPLEKEQIETAYDCGVYATETTDIGENYFKNTFTKKSTNEVDPFYDLTQQKQINLKI